jgi:hypothetical protein
VSFLYNFQFSFVHRLACSIPPSWAPCKELPWHLRHRRRCCALSVSTAQPQATFQVVGCSSIVSSPASPPISATRRSMSRLGPATLWRGLGGRLVRRQTYVTNLQVKRKYIHKICAHLHQRC